MEDLSQLYKLAEQGHQEEVLSKLASIQHQIIPNGSQKMDKTMPLSKVIVIGDSSVGKTCLI
jgi:hypothetical protein